MDIALLQWGIGPLALAGFAVLAVGLGRPT
jgi:hypothetical protein